MNIETPILVEIFRDISFTKEESILIAPKFEKIQLKKGHTLLQANDVVYNQYYVSSGCLRTYFMDKSGKEHTLQFAIKDWWISDYTAFFTTTKAAMTIECIQEAIVYKISKKDVESLYAHIPKIETLFRKKWRKVMQPYRIEFSLVYPNQQKKDTSLLSVRIQTLNRV